jgi:transposase
MSSYLLVDGSHAADKLKTALTEIGDWTIEVIKVYKSVKEFAIMPVGWVVQRTFTWLNPCRRLVKYIGEADSST